MKKVVFFYLMVFFMLINLVAYSQSKDWSIVQTYSIPDGSSGLAWDGTYIYIGSYGSTGQNIYRFDPSNGTYSFLYAGPQEDTYGLTYDGTYLWTTDHPGSSSNPAIAIKMSATGGNIGQFNLPDHYMSGIAYDNGNFWVSTYYDPDGYIYKLNNTGTILKGFAAPDNQPWALSMGDSCLWMADYWGDAIYKIDTANGSLINSYPSEGVDPAGVVFDGTYLWYCDEGSGSVDFLYKVSLTGSGTPAINLLQNSHNYGAVTINTTSTWNLQVQNTGTADLVISNIVFPVGEPLSTTIVFPFTIAAGATMPIPINYLPTSYAALNTTINIISNDPVHPSVNVNLRGFGVYDGPALNLSQKNHDFGSIRWFANTRWILPIESCGDTPLVIDTIISSESNFFVDAGLTYPVSISTLDTAKIRIWYHPENAATDNGYLYIYSNNTLQNPDTVSLHGISDQSTCPIGKILWHYTLTEGIDVSPKAILSIPDITGDGINDVIIASEDYTYRCFNGNASGTGDIIWENKENGSLYQQNGIQLIEDINNDGYSDIIVGSAWGDRSVIAISGKTGVNLWKYDTHIFGDGGWIYQVNVSFDYNGDGRKDVLAASGDDANGTGPRRVHCLNGLNGSVIWEYQVDGAVFSVAGVEDFTHDGIPDVIAGATNSSETEGKFIGLDGSNGTLKWTQVTAGSSVWAITQLPDINNDGIKDVAAADFGMSVGGNTYFINPVNGNLITSGNISNATIVLGFEKMDDINGDGKFDLIPSHSGSEVVVLNGMNSQTIWNYPVANPDKPWCSRVIEDISGDGINDVVAGTLYTANELYFLNGINGSNLHTIAYGEPIDALGTIYDITNDGSMEVIAGGRDGKIVCYSGGLGSLYPEIDAPLSHDFGQVITGNVATWNMTVNNSGNAALRIDTIEAFNLNNNYYSTADFPIIISPGLSQDIGIIFNAVGTVGNYNDSIKIISNDPVFPEFVVDVEASITTGIDENSISGYARIYPNPVKEKAFFEIGSDINQMANIKILNSYSQEVYTKDQVLNQGINNIEWNGCDNNGNKLVPGIYFLQIKTVQGTKVQRFVILK